MGISAVPNLFVKQQLTTKLAASETLKDDTVVVLKERCGQNPTVTLFIFSFVLVEWIAAVSLAAGAAAVGYLAYKKFLSKDKCCKAMVNPSVQKDNPKVVHAFDVEDLGDKAVYCRCWRSKKFPLCDGSHIKHNEETGDNVGPLIIKRKEA
ncbi:CDGSH iron sulfur domain 1 [Columba livia]|uniref:CDGSH iron-sulfur domain-containing protein 2 n=1 Tax=Columba livia TaxID=8932 RepID=A0A2I0LX34_COLLI|nr:CDGSH iron sulfur domain 1 [Columba livia]